MVNILYALSVFAELGGEGGRIWQSLRRKITDLSRPTWFVLTVSAWSQFLYQNALGVGSKWLFLAAGVANSLVFTLSLTPGRGQGKLLDAFKFHKFFASASSLKSRVENSKSQLQMLGALLGLGVFFLSSNIWLGIAAINAAGVLAMMPTIAAARGAYKISTKENSKTNAKLWFITGGSVSLALAGDLLSMNWDVDGLAGLVSPVRGVAVYWLTAGLYLGAYVRGAVRDKTIEIRAKSAASYPRPQSNRFENFQEPVSVSQEEIVSYLKEILKSLQPNSFLRESVHELLAFKDNFTHPETRNLISGIYEDLAKIHQIRLLGKPDLCQHKSEDIVQKLYGLWDQLDKPTDREVLEAFKDVTNTLSKKDPTIAVSLPFDPKSCFGTTPNERIFTRRGWRLAAGVDRVGLARRTYSDVQTERYAPNV